MGVRFPSPALIVRSPVCRRARVICLCHSSRSPLGGAAVRRPRRARAGACARRRPARGRAPRGPRSPARCRGRSPRTGTRGASASTSANDSPVPSHRPATRIPGVSISDAPHGSASSSRVTVVWRPRRSSAHLARLHPLLAEQRVDQRRLAGAGRAEQDGGRAGREQGAQRRPCPRRSRRSPRRRRPCPSAAPAPRRSRSRRRPGQLRDAGTNLVVNLLGIPLQDRPAFFAQLFPRLQAMRAHTGRPHWIVIDQVHHLLPATWGLAPSTLPQRLGETILITYRPREVAPSILALVDTAVAVGPSPDGPLAEFATAHSRTSTCANQCRQTL